MSGKKDLLRGIYTGKKAAVVERWIEVAEDDWTNINDVSRSKRETDPGWYLRCRDA